MSISQQIRLVGFAWALYGVGFVLMRILKIEQMEAILIFFDLLNIVLGIGLVFRNEIMMGIGRVYLWIFLCLICSIPYGARSDFGTDPRLTAMRYLIPVLGIVFLLWFLRRPGVFQETVKVNNNPTIEITPELKRQKAFQTTLVWWLIIIFLTSGVWSPLLLK